ncbi:phosphate/phosphite/phosphonate ABC transporter substrate-binding protein [Lacticaseibacillus sharpeae]|uniref:ABC-type phosphate phosphonate transport system, periplasmic component n=1 Tax=Lacticaseibacillus sharpeae JCM 1186 = DSM 20505 TaxID=1291052 RepID=A0A0R1ZHW6_9LACO|nr:phosphate/phosphite/phosphonate ABC transporter substrate-binding protein [Lacticaseibacillus sharpeae]KRM54576.1 ABC-type phosphate phosphonate transport system, periplasmic component [Lacticaseibacillus sharpeae JCM 1186 = DSM 20505]
MKFWKTLAVTGVALLAAVSLTACGSKSSSTAKNSSSKGYTPKSLNIQFVPSSSADTIEAKAKPLEKLLKAQLHIPVKVSVSTDYNSIVEAMDSKQVDVGFLPPDGYVQAHKQGAADILLQAERYGIKQPGGKTTNKLVKNYRSMIVVKKGSNIKSYKDLKGKKIAVQDVTSSAGYIWPVAELKNKGIDIPKDNTLVTVKGHDQGVMSVLNGDTDAAFVFEDARTIVQKDVPDIMNKVEPIYFTKPIPNDTISVREDMSAAFRKKLAAAFIKIAKSKKGHAIISSVYTHEGYVKAKDSDFNIVRKYDKIANSESK